MPRLSLLEIARIEEERQARGTADVSQQAQEIAGGWMCFSGGASWSNQASGLGLSGPVSSAELDQLVEYYVSRDVEPRIEVCPFADPSLTQGLAERGFTLRQFENVLARELEEDEDFRALLPHGVPEGIELVTVDTTDADQARQYIEIATSGFRSLDEPIDPDLFEISRRTLEHPLVTAYFATADGIAAGGGAMEARGEASALFGTSVLEEFRRRGIQQIWIARRLEMAREAGCKIAVIQSLPGMSTERNARRMGFFLAYTKAVLAQPLG